MYASHWSTVEFSEARCSRTLMKGLKARVVLLRVQICTIVSNKTPTYFCNSAQHAAASKDRCCFSLNATEKCLRAFTTVSVVTFRGGFGLPASSVRASVGVSEEILGD